MFYAYTTICVSDMDKAIAFYRDVLGLEQVGDAIVDDSSERKAYLEQLLGLSDVHCRMAHFKTEGWEERQNLELIQWYSPQPKPLDRQQRSCDTGVHWFGLRSKDVEADYRRLKDQGVRFISPPLERADRPGFKVCFFHDPDGNILILHA
ncbi:MAG: VOC family protein [Chloroflexi bacterium]|nr:VOC family protein [Chloroflexota bacterium]